MRIIRGILKSRRFTAPKNFPSRPTTDFAKEGLFNILENRLTLSDLSILDLCAGTGNISFEFASREAGKIIAVDTNFNCVRFIQKTVQEIELTDVIQVYKSDARDYLRKCTQTFDLIFIDPPYDVSFHEELIDSINDKSLLKPGAICIIEHGRRTNLTAVKNYVETRSFGNVHFSFFKSN